MGFSDGLLQMMSSIRFEGEWRQDKRGLDNLECNLSHQSGGSDRLPVLV